MLAATNNSRRVGGGPHLTLALHALLAALVAVVLCAPHPVSSSYDYCGAPQTSAAKPLVWPQGPSDLSLKTIMVTIRHGDRTPVSLLPAPYTDNVQWRCNLTQLSAIDSGLPLTAVTSRLYRKRYVDNREVLPGNCMFGQLTEKGASQHHALGRELRKIYVDQYKFLSQHLEPSELWVRSTDVPRTIASAQSLLYGLFPNNRNDQTQIIDFDSIDSNKENMVPNVRLCPRLAQVYAAMRSSPEFQAYETHTKALQDKLRSVFHVPANTPLNMIDIFDTYRARTCHGLSLPAGTEPLADQIFAAGNFEESFFFNNTQALTLGIGSFVAEQVARLEQAANGKESAKLILYSGHDTTLWPLAFAYSFANSSEWPPYASHMVIELWHDRQTGQHLVRIIYNGEEKPVPGCAASDKLCPLDKFKAAVAGIIPKDFAAACTPSTAGFRPRGMGADERLAQDMQMAEQFFKLR